MIDPKTISEELMYTTARIVGEGHPDGTKLGSGFFYRVPVAEGAAVLLVTNKHVIDGAKTISFLMHAGSDDGKPTDGNITIHSNPGQWIPHPDDKVDLCALPINEVLNSPQHKVFYKTIDPNLIPSQEKLEELGAVEDILMIGYPNGLWDSINNYPLIRRGITASHPAVDHDVDGVPTTVVDMACFPGSSGSPVFLYNYGSYADKKGNLVWKTTFLGVLYSGPVMQADGKIVIRTIPTGAVPVAEVQLMLNLGYLVKSRELEPLGKAVLKKLGR